MECTATDTDDGRKQLTFRVYDDGEGMSREFQNHMYETFAQENRSSDSTIHGTGLGLAIVHNLIKLMKGTISVESEVGQGTVYHITMTVDKTEKTSADQQPLISLDILKGRQVLLCEDNMINAEIATTMEERLQQCDTVFFLDYPKDICLKGIQERKGKPRNDMPW